MNKTDCEGQQWETVYTWLKLAKEEEERQERGKRDTWPFGQTLLRQECNKKHVNGPGSKMLQLWPLVFQCMTRHSQFSHCMWQAGRAHANSTVWSLLRCRCQTSTSFCYFDYSGRRLQIDSHCVSPVWPLWHFKKFLICCQHSKVE